MKGIIFSVVSLSLILTLVACGPKRAVTRTSSDEVIDLSGRWNDTDSRLVSEEMIRDCLDRPWLKNFVGKKQTQPTVIVGHVSNKSYERISVETFTKDLERALLNSGEVNFVASSGQRDELRSERMDQAMHAKEETQKQEGQETGADFILKGQINSILDESGGQQVRFYQIELELINIESNQKVWIGQKKVKKVIDKKSVSW